MTRTIWIILLGTLAGCSSQAPGITTAALAWDDDDKRLQVGLAWTETVANSITFHTRLAQRLEEGDPSPLPPAREYWWEFVIETNVAQWPAGWPVAAGVHIPPELAVAVRWDGGEQYQAFLVNRQPLVDGNPAVIRSLDKFLASGDQIAITVDSKLLVDSKGEALDRFCFLDFGSAYPDSPFDHTWLADDGTRLGLSGEGSMKFAPFTHRYQPYGDATCP
jgi:hypothetical protein